MCKFPKHKKIKLSYIPKHTKDKSEKTISIRRKTISMLLLQQNIETNPNPKNEDIKPNLTLRTFNCNGLGNNMKMRRVFSKLKKEVQNGGIVMLQETHIVDENMIKMYWKMKYASNCISANRGGVITLFDNSYELLESHTDTEGRMTAIVIENDRLKTIVVNVYCHNDHRDSYTFIEKVYDKIYELMDEHPDAFVI